MAMLRVCREFGCLPSEVEERCSAGEFLELVMYLKVCDDEERKAHEKARQDAQRRR